MASARPGPVGRARLNPRSSRTWTRCPQTPLLSQQPHLRSGRIREVLTAIVGFAHLGMNHEQTEVIDRLIAQPYGAVLVAGPVGAGRTSTFYNCLERINLPLKNVMTIEDPIEHRISGVNQTRVNTQGDMGFSEGLRSMLRQDPDVIMIGEIRDEETARIGIRTALTRVPRLQHTTRLRFPQLHQQSLQLRDPGIPAL